MTLDPDIRQFILEECLSYSLTPQQASDVNFLKQLEEATIEKQQNTKTTPEKALRYLNSIYHQKLGLKLYFPHIWYDMK